MKQVSTWAASNKILARFSIVAIYIVLNIMAIATGEMLQSVGIILPPLFFLSSIFAVLAALFFYPSKAAKARILHFYFRQKTCDWILGFATFLMVMYSADSARNISILGQNSAFGNLAVPGSQLLTKRAGSKPDQKENLKAVKNFVKAFRKKLKEATKTQKTIYIILTIIGALLVTYFLAGLSCSIACSGAEGLAIVVFAIGFAALIFGVVRLIHRIVHGKPLKKPVTDAAS